MTQPRLNVLVVTDEELQYLKEAVASREVALELVQTGYNLLSKIDYAQGGYRPEVSRQCSVIGWHKLEGEWKQVFTWTGTARSAIIRAETETKNFGDQYSRFLAIPVTYES